MLPLVLALACAPALPEVAAEPPVQDLRITSGELTLSAASAWVEDDLDGHAEEVRAELPPLVVEGERSTWSLADGEVVFEGKVRATRGPVLLQTEHLRVRYQGDRIVLAEAEGQVRVSRGERVARARRATLHVDSGRIVLTGDPTLEEGGRSLQGEEIVLFLDEDRAECSRCRLVVEGQALAPREDP